MTRRPFKVSPTTLDALRYPANPRAVMGDNKPPSRLALLRELATDLVSYECDPLGFVYWAFAWGEGELAGEEGPDEWQREQLDEIGRRLRKGERTGIMDVIREARASGHGIGKSALVGWLILWAMFTFVNTRGVITANTDTQLKTKTWAELSKWYHLLANPLLKDQFELEATSLHSTAKGKERTWRIDAIPNSERNPAAFAGLHNAGRRILIIFDEASEIPDVIWDTAEGATTDKNTQIVWAVYGNPTQNTGRFKEVVEGRLRHMWTSAHIDARNVKRTNHELQAEWIAAWGLDSDFVRTRVTGRFPRLGSMQLISGELVAAARSKDREPLYIPSDPLVAGLDVARYGDDQSVLAPRRGRDARTIPWRRFRGIDLMQLAGEAALWCQTFRPDGFFVDVSGLGVGVYDRMVQLGVANVFPADFGGAGKEVEINATRVNAGNLRAAMWCSMAEWLKFGAIPDEAEIETDMVGTQYSFNASNAIMMEPKAAMKARGLASPDNADALACTFAFPVAPRMTEIDRELRKSRSGVEDGPPSGLGYDPFRDLR